MNGDRVVFLIDMNAYFAAVEQAANPLLRGRPVVVCGEGRTVVTTASYEARRYGVKTGMTLPEARRLCPVLVSVRGDMDKYLDTTLLIHRVLLGFSDLVEPVSIDECFVDATRLCCPARSPEAVAREMKCRIREETGLLCSVGIGHNRMLAKLASKMQKPDGLVRITRGDIPELFSRLSVDDLQGVGVGRKTSARLKSLGITTAAQLGKAPLDLLYARFGIPGHRLGMIGRGEDSDVVRHYDEHDPVKSVGHSHTLPRDTSDLRVLGSYLLMLAEKTGARLRRYGLEGRSVCLTVRYGDFHTVSRQRKLSDPVRVGHEIYAAARGVFSSLLPLRKAVRLLGVSVGSVSAPGGQGYLFGDVEKRRRVSAAVDEINSRYGEFTVKPSSLLISERFGVRGQCGMIGRRLADEGRERRRRSSGDR